MVLHWLELMGVVIHGLGDCEDCRWGANMNDDLPEGNVWDEVEGFIEVNIKVKAGGRVGGGGLQVVDVVQGLVAGPGSKLGVVQEVMVSREARKVVREMGGEKLVDGGEKGDLAIALRKL